ncbi:MAG TPA: hypothetical protein VH088_12415 [Terriglobales bacterium]|nr:hypothetical protein [Terriglobales bacterium]
MRRSNSRKVDHYYVAADEVERNYIFGRINKMTGVKFEGYLNERPVFAV